MYALLTCTPFHLHNPRKRRGNTALDFHNRYLGFYILGGVSMQSTIRHAMRTGPHLYCYATCSYGQSLLYNQSSYDDCGTVRAGKKTAEGANYLGKKDEAAKQYLTIAMIPNCCEMGETRKERVPELTQSNQYLIIHTTSRCHHDCSVHSI